MHVGKITMIPELDCLGILGDTSFNFSPPFKVSAQVVMIIAHMDPSWRWLSYPRKFNLTPEKWWLEAYSNSVWSFSDDPFKGESWPLGDEKITNWITWYFPTWEVSDVPLKFAPEKLSESIPSFFRVKVTVNLHQVHLPPAFKAAVARSFVVWGACEINKP